jgi:hypothetical protein
MPELTTVCGW